MKKRLKKFLVGTGLLFGAMQAANAMPVIYGTDSPGGHVSPQGSTLYSINPATGAATSIGAIGFDHVTGIDFHPTTGALYGVGFAAGTTDWRLITINTSTGAGTSMADLPDSHQYGNAYPDISFRNGDNSLFAYLESGDGLGTINLGTGALTQLGSTGVSCCGNGIAFSTGDTLYHTNENALHTLNQTSGVASTVVSLAYPGNFDFTRIRGLDFDYVSGTLYGAMNNGEDGGTGYLVTVNTSSGAVNNIGATGIAFNGIAVANENGSIPEPTTLALMGLGLAGMGFARKKKQS